MIHIGFTGTREGMSNLQMHNIILALEALRSPYILHHGACIGADQQMHELVANEHGFKRIVVHPGLVKSQLQMAKPWFSRDTREAKPPLDRNRDIVNECDIVLAAPLGLQELVQSGTWYTIRYARKHHKMLRVVYRDGTIGR